jgi:hypothetical protein
MPRGRLEKSWSRDGTIQPIDWRGKVKRGFSAILQKSH